MMYYGPGQMPANNGYMYNQPQLAKPTNPLTPEEIASLKQNNGQFSLAINETDILRGRCFHRDETGRQTTVTNTDGSCTCTMCGYTWHSDELTEDQVREAVQRIMDVLQTIKLMYVNFPVQAAREYYQVIPLLDKIPGLYKVAADNFRMNEGTYGSYSNGNMDPFAMFRQVSSGYGFNPNMYGGYQQPMGQPAPQYDMYGQPVAAQPNYGYPTAQAQPTYGYPQGQMTNPFDPNAYGAQANPTAYAQTMGQQPMQVAPGPVYQPGTVAQPAAQPAATSGSEVTTSGDHTP
jgi:hypothetical protein